MIQSVIVELTDPELVRGAPGNRYFTSLEGENKGGSIKDRMVIGELTELLDRGTLKRGDWIGEVSMGSTARSLAVYASELGLRCALFVPEFLPKEEIDLMKELGAEVHPVPLEGAFDRYHAFCVERGVRPFEQLKDKAKRRFYSPLGQAVARRIGVVQGILGAVGTGHSLLGTADGIQPRPWIMSAEPCEGHVSGIRNIASERYGPGDPCEISLFDERMEIGQSEYFPGDKIETTLGPVSVSDSFRVVLGCALRVSQRHRGWNFFLVGAANRRVLR